jgi:protein SCO1/2
MSISSPGLTEHVGGRVPPDIKAVDDRGATVKLVDLADRPVILALVYYTCEHVCPLVLGALNELAATMSLAPGRDYRIVTLSFDAADTPSDAATARVNYTKPLGPAFPAGAWSFLTASSEDIGKLTDALGFRFEKRMHGFIHPSALIILGPGGRISGYVHVSQMAYGVGYPVTFPAGTMEAELRTAAAGADAGRDPAPLLFCYPSEPAAQGRFYGLMTTMGVGTLVLMAVFFVYMSVRWRRPRPGEGGPR